MFENKLITNGVGLKSIIRISRLQQNKLLNLNHSKIRKKNIIPAARARKILPAREL